MAVKKPTLYLLCGPVSAAKSAQVEFFATEHGVEVISIDAVNARRGYPSDDLRIDTSVIEESVEVILFEIITAGMSGQSIAFNDVSGDQSLLDRYRANAVGSGMRVEEITF